MVVRIHLRLPNLRPAGAESNLWSITMRSIRIVCDSFAVVEDSDVIAVVTKCNDTQWGIYPLIPCKPIAVAQFIPLRYALEEAIKLERASP